MKDIEEVSFCVSNMSTPEPTFLLAMSGKFPKQKVLPTPMEVAQSEAKKTGNDASFKEVKVVGVTLHEREGMMMGETSDGVTLVSGDKSLNEGGGKASDNFKAYKLATDQAIFISVQAQPLLMKAGSELKGSPFDGAAWLSTFSSVHMAMAAKPTQLEVAFNMNATADMKKVDQEFPLQWAQLKGGLAAQPNMPPVLSKLLL